MRTSLIPSLLLVTTLSGLLWADEPKEAPALATQGALSQVEENFYELTYRKQVPGKKRPQSFKAYLEVSESTTWFADAQARPANLKEGMELWLYGSPVESESVNENGQTLIDRQVRGVLAIATGEGVILQAGKDDAKGPRWIQATVSKGGQALQVKFKGEDFRVLMTRNCAILVRQKLDGRPPKLKKKLQAAIVASKSDARPKKNKAKIEDSFSATHLVLLNKRLNAAYALMSQPAK